MINNGTILLQVGGRLNPIWASFVTHGVTHNKKWARAETVTHCLKWSGREDLNLRPPAPKAGTLARLRHAPIFCSSLVHLGHFLPLFYG